MASQGRQYPDGPHLAAREIVAIQRAIDMTHPAFRRAAQTAGRFRAAVDRLYADPGVTADEVASLGQMMHSLLGAPERPGPPYVHTFAPPEPEYDDEGNEIWRPLDPTHTLTGEGVRFEIGAVVPPGERVEITAGFCQCPACREARYEP